MSQEAPRRVIACIGALQNSSSIMPFGAITANALGAELTLLHVIETDNQPGARPDPIASDLLRREAATTMSDLARKWGNRVDNIQTTVLEGRAGDQICIWARDHHVDLTIICSGHEDDGCGWALGDTARRVIDCVEGSVLIAPSVVDAVEKVRLKKILTFLDGSCRAETALPIAMQLAKAEQAELTLVHAIPEPQLTEIGPPRPEDEALRQRLFERNEAAAHAYFNHLQNSLHDSGVEIKTRILKGGDARHALLRSIDEEQADLVVVSSHGHSGHMDVSAGSVASHMITHTPVPLLLVRGSQQQTPRTPGVGEQNPGLRFPFHEAV